tara:strand:- start:88 stop:1887 length:1800 start_codon:yes stop_codon:yes gene_type:complete
MLNKLSKINLIKIGRLHNKTQKELNLKEIKQLKKESKENLDNKIKMLKKKNLINVQFGTKEQLQKDLLLFSSDNKLNEYYKQLNLKVDDTQQKTSTKSKTVPKASTKADSKTDVRRQTINDIKKKLFYVIDNPTDKRKYNELRKKFTGKIGRYSKDVISFLKEATPKLYMKLIQVLNLDLEKPKINVEDDEDAKIYGFSGKMLSSKDIDKLEDEAEEKSKKEVSKPKPKPQPKPVPKPVPKKEEPKRSNTKTQNKLDDLIKEASNKVKQLKNLPKEESIANKSQEKKDQIIKSNEKITNDRTKLKNDLVDLEAKIKGLQDKVQDEKRDEKNKQNKKELKDFIKLHKLFIKNPSDNLLEEIDNTIDNNDELLDLLEEEEPDLLEDFDDAVEKYKKSKSKPKSKPKPKPEPKKEDPKPKPKPEPKKELPKPKPKPEPKKEEPKPVNKVKVVKPQPKPEPKKEEDCVAKRSGPPTKPTSRKDFFKQSLKYHPDRNPDCIDYATEMFKKLNNLNAGKDEKGSDNDNIMTEDEKDMKAYFTKEVFKDIKFNFKIRQDVGNGEYVFIFTIKESKEVQEKIRKKLQMVRLKVFKNSFKVSLRNIKK